MVVIKENQPSTLVHLQENRGYHSHNIGVGSYEPSKNW